MKLTEKDRQKLADLYAQGKSLTEIGAALKIHRDTARNHLRKLGLHKAQKGPGRVDEILEAYAETRNISQVARQLGLDRAYVRKIVNGERDAALPDPEAGVQPATVASRRRFVITSALNDCPVHAPFFQSLLQYCERNNAQLLVIPVRYRNVSLFNQANDEPQWPSELDPYWVTGDVELSSNLVIMGSLRIQATAARPLRSLPGISKGRSAVFGHPRIALEMVPTPLKKMPMVYLTTGSVSLPSYSETKAGRLGDFHHSIAAAIVETDGKFFWWRHVHSGPDGGFIDFETRYLPTRTEPAAPAEAMVLGDVHVGFDNSTAISALLGDLARTCRVQNIVLHDVLDFFSASHHHTNNRVLQVLKEARGLNSVYDELRQVAHWMEQYLPEDATTYVIRSNHHDHLERWLNNNSAAIDAKNMWLWHHLNAAQMKEALDLAQSDPAGQHWHVTPAFELAIRALVAPEVNRRIKFHDDREPLEFAGIDFSNHGDRGPNGSRGSRSGFAQVQRRTFIAHSHTPGITDGCYQVGMSCRSDLPYMSGYSSHFTASGIAYADGHRTLFPIINGRYRLGGDQ